MKKKICVITGSRAEYGLLRWLLKDLKKDSTFILQIIATGMHLSPEFGCTYLDIEKDGFVIDRKIEMLVSSDTVVGITKSIGLGVIGFADAFDDLKPDLILVLGDRFEIFSAVSAALVARIPVCHLYGGELTEGLIDEAIRHSITKMSHIHFVATNEYKKRVIQLGENPKNVFLVGGLGIDNIKRENLLNRTSLENSLGFKFGKKNLLITFHPVTLDYSSAKTQLKELLSSLHSLNNTHVIFTLPNADTDSRILVKMIKEFVVNHSSACFFTSLGQLRYFSCIAQVDAVIGNSSSGLLEVPSFKKATINIGDRQRGRIQAESVINCEPSQQSIDKAIQKAYSKDFQAKLKKITNPYEKKDSAKIILRLLKKCTRDPKKLIKKSFYNLGDI
jgi:GDP/UDP-N,N'-diacetylbacillosamine 2-epimerase (hydrolysing)